MTISALDLFKIGIGPTVCELDGPMPILNRSRALMVMGDGR